MPHPSKPKIKRSERRAKERITEAYVHRIALCKRGKNGLKTLLKSAGAHATMVRPSKTKGELLVVVAVPEWVDDDLQTQDNDIIEDMMSSWIDNGCELELEHIVEGGAPITSDQVKSIETFRVQPGDARFADWTTYEGEPVDVTGGWAVRAQIKDPEIKELFDSQDWDGVSLYGLAASEQLQVKAASQRVAAAMATTDPKTNNMTPEELAAALKAHTEQVALLVKSAVAESLAAPENITPPADPAPKDDAPERPVFSGDASSADDLEAYERELKAFEIQTKIADGTLDSAGLAELVKSARATQPKDEELVEAGLIVKNSEPTPRELTLAREIFEMRKSTASAVQDAPRAQVPNENAEADKAVDGVLELLNGRYDDPFKNS